MSHLAEPTPEPPTPLGRLRVMSPHAGVRMSPLQLGAMSIGDAWNSYMGVMDKESSIKLLDKFYECGGVSIDTANIYQNEQSEEWIGEWMEAKGIRDELVIATKYSSCYKAYAVGKNRGINHQGNHRKSMHISVRDSLKKLRTDYIDIFYIHWWDYTTSIKEVMDSLHTLVDSGKVLYLGVSDTPAWIVSAANQYAIDNGKTPFTIYQGRWSCMMRDFEREILPMAREFGMALAPFGALGSGRIQSKEQMEERKARGDILRPGRGPNELTDAEIKMSEVLVAIGEKHGTTNPATVALAYVMCKAPYVFPIVGGRRVEHLVENIKAIDLKLTSEEMAEIEGVAPFDMGFPNTMLGPDPRLDNQKGGVIANMLGTVDYVLHPQPI